MTGVPKISVITPSFNQGPFIRDTIESVLQQDGDDWEHVVVDGGSTDETVSILQEYPHLIWVSEPDAGQSDALNKAMTMSRGDIVFWINSDDEVAPGAFAAVLEFFSANPEASIVFGNAVTIDEKGDEIRRFGNLSVDQLRRPWNGSTSLHQPCIVFRRVVYDTTGPIDVSLHLAMDYDFFLRASRHFEFFHLPVNLGLFREYTGTKTGDGAAESFREVRESVVRYVQETGDGSPRWTAIRAYLSQASAWVNDAVFFYERGEPEIARGLLWKALLRYPPSLMVRPHLRYRLIQIIGPSAFESLRTRVKGGAG